MALGKLLQAHDVVSLMVIVFEKGFDLISPVLFSATLRIKLQGAVTNFIGCISQGVPNLFNNVMLTPSRCRLSTLWKCSCYLLCYIG